MRLTSIVVALLLMLSAHVATAQDRNADPTVGDQESETMLPGAAPGEDSKRVDELRAELKALLEQSREGAADVVREFQTSTGLSDSQVYGIAAGIVVGAVIADFMGGGGLATITLAAGGGALGNWIMAD